MTGYESKRAAAQDKITDEQGRPMTYWGGKAQPALEPAIGDIRALKHRIYELEGEVIGYKRILNAQIGDIQALKHRIYELEGEVIGYKRILDAQPAQEPVAWMHVQGDYEEPSWRQLDDDEIEMGWKQYPLYTTPPQRTWVGLTEKEKKEIYGLSVYVEGAISLTEAKLKDKNNG